MDLSDGTIIQDPVEFRFKERLWVIEADPLIEGTKYLMTHDKKGEPSHDDFLKPEEKEKRLLTAQLHFFMNCLSELSKESLQSRDLSQLDNNENKAKLPADFPPIEPFDKEPPISFEKACEEIHGILKQLYENDWIDCGDDVVIRAIDHHLLETLFCWHDPMITLLEDQPDDAKKMILRLCRVSPNATKSRIIQEALEWLTSRGDKEFFEKFGKVMGPKKAATDAPERTEDERFFILCVVHFFKEIQNQEITEICTALTRWFEEQGIHVSDSKYIRQQYYALKKSLQLVDRPFHFTNLLKKYIRRKQNNPS